MQQYVLFAIEGRNTVFNVMWHSHQNVNGIISCH